MENSLACLELSHDELVTLANALNEVLHGFEVNEFGSRIGVPREEASLLHESLLALLKQYPRPTW